MAVDEFVPGQILVGFKADLAVDNVTQNLDVLSEEEVFFDEEEGYVIYLLVVDPESQDEVLEALAYLNDGSEESFAEPDYIVDAAAIPNDPDYPLQWNLSELPENSGIGWEKVWNWGVTGSPSVVVAVLDTGISFGATDRPKNILPSGRDFVNRDDDPSDDNGHGTHIAGVIAQNTSNGIATAGIASDVSILPVKVLDEDGDGRISRVVRGIRWSARNDADVINMSFVSRHYSVALRWAVRYANRKDAVLVGASGNGSTGRVGYPAAYDDVIAVGATDMDSNLWVNSNYGRRQDLVAPGDGIYQQTFIQGNPTQFDVIAYSGTSQAAAHVSGVAALLYYYLELEGVNKNLIPDRIFNILRDTAYDLGAPGKDDIFGHGLLNAADAVLEVLPNDPPTAVIEVEGSEFFEGTPIIFDGTNSTDPDGTIVEYLWDFDDGETETGSRPSHSYADNGVYVVKLTVTDNLGASDTDNKVLLVKNAVPVVNGSLDNDTGYEGSDLDVELTVNFDDPGTDDTHVASVNWGDGTVPEIIDPATSPFSLQHTYVDNLDDTVYTITIEVEDDDGDSGFAYLDVTIMNVDPEIDDDSPVLTDSDDEGDDISEGEVVTLTAKFTDVGVLDTHVATVDWGDGVTDTVDPVISPLEITHAYGDNGTYRILVTVTDDDGDKDEDALYANVNNVDPVVDSAAIDNEEVDEGEDVTLTTEFSDVGVEDTHTLMIDWGDGSSSTVSDVTSPAEVAHAYADNGEYSITVTLTDDDDGEDVYPDLDADPPDEELIVTVNNLPPIVDAGDDQTVDEGETVEIEVTVTDPGTADTHTATIDWGDGSEPEDATVSEGVINASHVYADNSIESSGASGDYIVTVTVTDDDGGEGMDELTVTVNNVAPVADIGDDMSADEGSEVTVTATFTDVGSADTHSLTLDWGDGSDPVSVDPAVSPVELMYSYPDDGEFTVTLTVTDDDGGVGVDTATITVNNVAPDLADMPDMDIDEVNPDDPDNQVVIDIELTDPGIDDTHTITIDWGDGSDPEVVPVDPVDPEEPEKRTATATHNYADPEVVPPITPYEVTVTVVDDDGGEDEDIFNVTINNVDPVLGPAVIDEEEINEAEEITLEFSFTDGHDDDHTVVIDWGDGETTTLDITEPEDRDVAEPHTYADDGVYEVSITVTDDEGRADWTEQPLVVTVLNLDPVLDNFVLMNEDGDVIASADEGQEITIELDVTDGAADTHKVTIDWGDGSSPTVINYSSDDQTFTVAATHTYKDETRWNNGNYEVAVTVVDDDSGETEEEFDILVNNLPPDVEIAEDQPTDAEQGAPFQLQVEFEDPGIDDVHTAEIHWGDLDEEGNPNITEIDPAVSPITASHTYEEAGVFNVTVEVTDDGGATGQTALAVNVLETGGANIVETTLSEDTIDEGQSVTVTATFTDWNDPDDTHTASIDWGDGSTTTGTLVEPAGKQAGSVTSTHTYQDDSTSEDDGVFEVKVTITDKYGNESFGDDTATITVNNVDPVVDEGTDKTIDEGSELAEFTITFSDVGADDTHTIELDWGDGNVDDPVEATSPYTVETPTHIYADNGTYTLTVTVTDDDGGVGTDTMTVTVNNVAPDLEDIADVELNSGETLNVEASFTDPGTADTFTTTIDFGDGTVLGPVDTASPIVVGPHTYTDKGGHVVTVTVTDDDGGKDTDTFIVLVKNAAPVVNANNMTVNSGQLLNLEAEFDDPGDPGIHVATIDWGEDGEVEDGVVTEPEECYSGKVTGSHTYMYPGQYDVTVTVIDNAGAAGEKTIKVTVLGLTVNFATYNMFTNVLKLYPSEAIDPELTCFNKMAVEINNSGNRDIELADGMGLIARRCDDNIYPGDSNYYNGICVDLTPAIAAVKSINMMILKHLQGDYVKAHLMLDPGAFTTAYGKTNVAMDATIASDMVQPVEILMVPVTGDVNGNGDISSLDASMILQSTVKGNGVFPINDAATSLSELFGSLGHHIDVMTALADLSGNGEISVMDAALALQIAVGLEEVSAAPSLGVGSRTCSLRVSNYESQNLEVSIDLDDVRDLYAAEIVLNYDPKALTVADVSTTSATADWISANSAEAGHLRISLAGAYQPVADGSLVTIAFDGLQDAIGKLDIVDIKLNDGILNAKIENLPKAFAVFQNYPNPFNPETWIPYQLSKPTDVSITIYNVSGQLVKRLDLGSKTPGHYTDKSKAAYWDGTNEAGERVSSGIYFYQLQAGQDASVRKMIVVK
jgi:subtilisin family serine protease